ncbi:hypothetical protein HGRIS_000245 [Hohenbuehelia grisea]|uniref:MYND-type domain-containing protein n=1 Tax=Hohenbuehelia grisea TaxID=104357 RepID=A0ABR3JRT5_9AGAR
MMQFLWVNCTGLQALFELATGHYPSIQAELAQHSSAMIDVVRKYPDDRLVADVLTQTLSRFLAALFNVGKSGTPDEKTLRVIDVPAVFRFLVDMVNPYSITGDRLNNTLSVLSLAVFHCPAVFKADLSLQRFVIAGLRCRDWGFRMTCLQILMALNDTGGDTGGDSEGLFDLGKINNAFVRGFPVKIADAMSVYGKESCDLARTLWAVEQNEMVLEHMQRDNDPDIYPLGLTLAKLIPETEHSILIPLDSLATGGPLATNTLTLCAESIRYKGKPEELHLADFLDIKSSLLLGRSQDASRIARRAIERSPDVAYFYHVQADVEPSADALRTAKKGLRCKKISTFVRCELLYTAIVEAASLSGTLLMEAPLTGKESAELGATLLEGALEDAKTFLEIAPPDGLRVAGVACWHCMLTFLVHGPTMTADLYSLKDTFAKLKLFDEIFAYLDAPRYDSRIRRTTEFVVEQLPEAIKEWGDVMSGDHKSPSQSSSTAGQDALASMLEKMSVQSREEDDDSRRQRIYTEFTPTWHRPGLYTCSWCKNCSAGLRKCGSCGKARYCDSSCQRAHWKEHKKSCSAATD